jgi:hypothetical protein
LALAERYAATRTPKLGVLGIGVSKHLWMTQRRPFMAASACSPAPFDTGLAESLAIQACDETDSLREVLSAYACLEKLIEPAELGDTEQVHPTRTELAALVGMVNLEMSRRLAVIDATLQSMRAELNARTTEASPAN